MDSAGEASPQFRLIWDFYARMMGYIPAYSVMDNGVVWQATFLDALRAIEAPFYLATRVSVERAYFWYCQGCAVSGEIRQGEQSVAMLHVSETGHEVHVISVQTDTYGAVNT